MGPVDWQLWRPVIAKIATLEEIEEHYSIDDLADAHDALDIEMEMQFKSSAKMNKK